MATLIPSRVFQMEVNKCDEWQNGSLSKRNKPMPLYFQFSLVVSSPNSLFKSWMYHLLFHKSLEKKRNQDTFDAIFSTNNRLENLKPRLQSSSWFRPFDYETDELIMAKIIGKVKISLPVVVERKTKTRQWIVLNWLMMPTFDYRLPVQRLVHTCNSPTVKNLTTKVRNRREKMCHNFFVEKR